MDNQTSNNNALDFRDPGPMDAALLNVPGFVNDLKAHTLASGFSPNETLAFSVKPLSAFRPDLKKLRPVNVNRIKQFRVTSIYPAEGPRKNRTVILGQDILIRGNSLNLAKHVNVSINVYDPFKRMGLSVDPEILSASETEIRCAWPNEVTAEHKHCSFCATVSHWDSLDDYRSREIYATIKSAG